MADNGSPHPHSTSMADNVFPHRRRRKSKSGWRRWKKRLAKTFVGFASLIGMFLLLDTIYLCWRFDLMDIEGRSVESELVNLPEAQIDSNPVCATDFTTASTEFGVNLTESEAQIDGNLCSSNLTEPMDMEGPIDREVWNAIDRRFEKMSEEMINRLNVLEEKHQLFEKGVDHLNSMLDEKHRLFEKALGQLNEEWSKSNLKLDEIGALVRQIMEQEIEHGHKSESPEPEPEPEPVQPNLDGLSNTVMKVITVISIIFALRMLFIIFTE